MRGSSHPSTVPSRTSFISLRLDVTVWVSSSRANSVWRGASNGSGSCSRYQSYSARWLSNSSVHSECVIALDRVALPVGPVVGRIDLPGVAGAVVVLVTDAVHHRIAQLHVLVLHVDLGAQHVRPLLELAGPHAPEQVEILLDRPVAVRALDARVAVAPALFGDRLARLVVDVRLAVA